MAQENIYVTLGRVVNSIPSLQEEIKSIATNVNDLKNEIKSNDSRSDMENQVNHVATMVEVLNSRVVELEKRLESALLLVSDKTTKVETTVKDINTVLVEFGKRLKKAEDANVTLKGVTNSFSRDLKTQIKKMREVEKKIKITPSVEEASETETVENTEVTE